MSGAALLQHANSDPVPEIVESAAEAAIYVDGGILDGNPGEGAVAAVLVAPNGEIITEGARKIGEATNNEAEYRALLYGISIANLAGVKRPHFLMDSALVVQQISGYWAINVAGLSRLHGFCTSRLFEFDDWSIQHVPRTQNKRADWLVNRILRGDEHKRTLKNAPTEGIQFRKGKLRPGWTNLRNPEYSS